MSDKIAAFWQWFQTKENDYFQLHHTDEQQEELFGMLSEALHKLDENLSFEFSALQDDGKKEFIISANGMQKSFQVVFQLQEMAPILPRWTVIALKPRHETELQLHIMDKKFGYDDIFFDGQINDQKVDLALYMRCDLPENILPQIGFIMLDIILGEYDVATMIGALDFYHLDETKIPSLKGFRELPALVDRLKN